METLICGQGKSFVQDNLMLLFNYLPSLLINLPMWKKLFATQEETRCFYLKCIKTISRIRNLRFPKGLFFNWFIVSTVLLHISLMVAINSAFNEIIALQDQDRPKDNLINWLRLEGLSHHLFVVILSLLSTNIIKLHPNFILNSATQHKAIGNYRHSENWTRKLSLTPQETCFVYIARYDFASHTPLT